MSDPDRIALAKPRRAVLFDLFGTLVEVDPGGLPLVTVGGTAWPSTIPRWIDLLRAYVGVISGADVFLALRSIAGPDAHDVTVERASRQRFRQLVERLGCPTSMAEEAGVVLSRAHMRAIAEATVVPPASRVVLDAARAIAAVGIVSNFDDTAGAYHILIRHGLAARVDTVVVSEAVGRRKPHPLPLVAALRSLEVEAADAVFVGDGRTADVGAAVAAGVQAVLIDRHPDDATEVPSGVIVVGGLGEVPDALGW